MFGPRIPEDGLEGHLIPLAWLHPNNKHGCSFVPPPGLRDWVVLVERGNCSFIEKVRNMQASGAIAVAVGDNEYNSLVAMKADEDTSDVVIPSVFLARQQYHRLLELANRFD